MCGNPIEAIAETVSDVGNAIVDTAGAAVDAVGDVAQTVVDSTVQAVESTVDVVVAPIDAAVGTVGDIFGGIARGQSFGDIVSNVGDEWKDAGGEVLTGLGGMAEAGVDIAMAEVKAVTDVGGAALDGLQEVGGPIGDIAGVVEDGAKWVDENKETILDVAQVAVPAVLAATGVGAPIAAAVAAGLALVEANMDGDISGGEFLEAGLDAAGSLVPGAGGLAGDIAQGGLEAVETLAEGGNLGDALKDGALEFVGEKLGEGAQTAVEAAVNVVENLAEGKEIGDALLQGAGELGKEALGDLLSDNSAIGKEISEALGEKGAEALGELMDSPVGDFLKGAGEGILEGKDLGEALKEGALDAGKDLLDNSELGGELKELLGEEGGIAEALKGLGGELLGEEGSNAFQGLSEMFGGDKDDFVDGFQDLVENFGGDDLGGLGDMLGSMDVPANAEVQHQAF